MPLYRSVFVLSLLLSVACSDTVEPPSPWGLTDPRGADSAPDQAVAAPDMAPDMTLEPGCQARLLLAERGVIPSSGEHLMLDIGPFTAGGELIWRQPAHFTPNREDDHVVAATPRQIEAPRTLATAPMNSRLLDAAAGRGGQLNLLYVIERGGQSTLVAQLNGREMRYELDDYTIPRHFDASFEGDGQKLLSQDRAAILLVPRDRRGASRLLVIDASGREVTVQLPSGTAHLPSVFGEDIVWSAPVDGAPEMNTILWMRDLDSPPQKIGQQPAHEQVVPVLVNQHVLWRRDGAIWMSDLRATFERKLLDGPCGAPHSDGQRAVVACGATSNPTWRAWRGHPRLYLIAEDLTPRRIYDSADQVIVAPRINGPHIAWIQYIDPSELCTPRLGEPAGDVRAMWHDAQTASEPLQIAPVSAPCFCCSAIWPPFTLSLDGGLLAWRYDLSEPDRHSLGWASLGPVRCEER